MNIFTNLRVLAFLRRIARALEQYNELTRERMLMDYPAWKNRPKPRPAQISVPTTGQWNERYRREQEDDGA